MKQKQSPLNMDTFKTEFIMIVHLALRLICFKRVKIKIEMNVR